MDKINHFQFTTEVQKEANKNNVQKEQDIRLEDISILYTTEKLEEDRSDFASSFELTSVMDSEDGAKFLNGLIENKDALAKELGLSEEQYDSLACIALGLASQETGMGEEEGYREENKGLGKLWRGFQKWIDVTFFHGASASSGLTQMKIQDFLNGDTLTSEQKQILKDFGIESSGISTNNLYLEPDKAAIATMVVLKSITENYDNYKDTLEDAHKEIEEKINDGLTNEERLEKGNKLLTDISEAYKNANDDEKKEIRANFKEWMLSVNNSKDGDKVNDNYNEEIQLNELNEALKGIVDLEANDINYIRYALTELGNEMDITQYCAYAWNKGTGETGMQLDRLLADKIGILLSNPEDFDYDQFTVNVTTLAEKYAEQSNINNDINAPFYEDLYG